MATANEKLETAIEKLTESVQEIRLCYAQEKESKLGIIKTIDEIKSIIVAQNADIQEVKISQAKKDESTLNTTKAIDRLETLIVTQNTERDKWYRSFTVKVIGVLFVAAFGIQAIPGVASFLSDAKAEQPVAVVETVTP